MYVTGPDVVKAELHEDVTHEELGGVKTHSSKSGVCHYAFEDELDALSRLVKMTIYWTGLSIRFRVREFFDFLPLNNKEPPPIRVSDDPPYDNTIKCLGSSH
eukprot:m.165029 g.165029  ORF g.165029 m.165029 type:complete len:102 (+) comp38890_c2_seq15:1236-1541(+)